MIKRVSQRIALGLVVAVVAGLLMLAAWAFWPLNPDELELRSEPVEDYDTAKREIELLLTEPLPGVREECRGQFWDHGRKTETVVVLLHGLTNCPAQFRAFAELAYEAGANVLVPRTPYHGLVDRMTRDQELLTAQGMLDTANRAVDLAQGLGKRVVVVGLSVNAVTAAWVAQHRGDVDLAVLMAPFFAPAGVGVDWVVPMARALYRAPNLFIWWDPIKRERLAGSEVSYPRFSTHAIAQVMRMGVDVAVSAEAGAPLAGEIVVMTSGADTAVNNDLTAMLVERWRAGGFAAVRKEEFPAELEVPHDAIDPAQPGAKTEIVYPELLRVIGLGR